MDVRAARRQFVEALRQSPPPSSLKLALYGLGAGAAATTVIGVMYLLVFGVLGSLLTRWLGVIVPTGFTVPVFPLFIGSLAWSAASGAILALAYHFVCRVLPRVAGVVGGVGFMLAVSLALQLAVNAMSASAPIELSSAVRVFGFVGSLVSSAILGAVVGHTELFERKPKPPESRAR